MKQVYDIAIAGSGPAAVVLARRLGALGQNILVVSRPRPFASVEGFSPRTIDLVHRHLIQHPEVLLPNSMPVVTRIVSWDGHESAANREAVVDRAGFDDLALKAGDGADFTVMNGRVLSSQRNTAGGWKLSVKTPSGETQQVSASFLVEARGRAAPLGGGGRVRGPALVALHRHWEYSGGVEGVAAAVASFRNGWAWFIRKDAASAVLQIFVDTVGDAASGPGLAAYYDSLVGQIPEAARWLEGAVPVGRVAARHAGMVLAGNLSAPDYLRVGDAAMAIDPLSGHGVYKAIGGALAAVPVINTLVHRPGDSRLAMDFYNHRVQDDFWTSARIARDFYRTESRWPDTPFWQSRRSWPDDEAAHAPIVPGRAEVRRHPVSRDDFIVAEDVLMTPDQPRGVWQVAGLPAAAVWDKISNGCQGAGDLAAAFDVPVGVADAALNWFRERGLVPSGDGSRT